MATIARLTAARPPSGETRRVTGGVARAGVVSGGPGRAGVPMR